MEDRVSMLVVEDHPPTRRAIVRILSAWGRVEAASSFAAARTKVSTDFFDAAFVDVTLPDGNGLELLEPLRQRNGAVVTLVLTGSTSKAVIRRVHEAGARFLVKPFGPEQLALVVDEARSRRRAGERRIQVVLARWVEDHGLSPAEAALLGLGARGVSREEFGEVRRVRPDTIRKQIKALLVKTGHETFDLAVKGLLREAVAEPL